MGGNPNKILIIGIDGGDPDFIFNRFKDRLPNIQGLVDRGHHGISHSTIPSATIPAWNSFYSGKNPGTHGMFDFTTPPDYNYNIHFINSRYRKIPVFWSSEFLAKKKCAILNFPSCYPPDEINGIMISGFDCPLPSGGDRSFIFPPQLYDEILKHFGPYRISGFDQVSLEQGSLKSASDSLIETAEYKGNVAEWLLMRENWDLFMVHFGEVDAACHHFWRYYDKDSPRRIRGENDGLSEVIPEVYSKIDEQIGKLLNVIEDDWVVLLLSDHGFAGTNKVVFHINNFLNEEGLLKFNKQPVFSDSRLKKLIKVIPVPLRKYLFRGLLGGVTNKVEGIRRFGNIDFSKTRAFSDELNYFPAIRINQYGKYKSGTVMPGELDMLTDSIRMKLISIKDKDDNAIVKNIYRREEIYNGRFTEEAPELIIEMNNPSGYLNGVLPSKPKGSMVTELSKEELIGGKGSFPTGGHRREGFFLLSNYPGDFIDKTDIQIFDLTEVIYYTMKSTN
ncbi:MAG: hypothetical protein GY855_04785 [candidate division Zixibacteria bacterium]|nr:hypothetical protein [candidate division Zixibacteria bacterium]